jgi:hypothetical protein
MSEADAVGGGRAVAGAVFEPGRELFARFHDRHAQRLLMSAACAQVSQSTGTAPIPSVHRLRCSRSVRQSLILTGLEALVQRSRKV